MLNRRIQSEIDDFFAEKYGQPKEKRQATSSSFTQSRAKIKYTAFKILMEELVLFFYLSFSYRKYYGYRLVAIDGSVLSLPNSKELAKEFGKNVWSSKEKWLKAQVSFATDVLNNICLAAEIGAYKENEVLQGKRLIKRLGGKNLYLFDRGYFSKDFLKQVSETGSSFCFRLRKNACKELTSFIKSDKDDSIEFIDVDGLSIKVRLSRICLASGEYEYLMTSLFDQKVFTISKLKALYHLRWGVEEQYKDMKYALCIENFIGKKPNSIKQEFYGNILSYNLSMMLCKRVIDRKSNKNKKKYKYKTNKRALLSKVKQCFVKLLYSSKNVVDIIDVIIEAVLKESIPIRNGRMYPRGKAIKAKRKQYRAYVSAV